MSTAPIIVAHRGLHHTLPENSVAAFEAAWNSGITWCECDVQLTADRRTAVLHDDTLDRTTTATGLIRDKLWEGIVRSKLRDAAGSETGHPLPLLSDVITAMPAGCAMLIELKPAMPAYGHVARMLMQRGARCMFQSFIGDDVQALCEAGLAKQTAFLLDDLTFVRDAIATGCSGVHLRHDLIDQRVVRQIKASGAKVGAWTVNEERDINRLLELDVDLIITDQPALAQSCVGRRTVQ